MFGEVKAFFNDLGWLANLLAVAPFGAIIWIYKKWGNILGWFNKRRYLSIADHMTSHMPQYTFDKRKVRLTIVDDNPAEFPVDYLRHTFGEVNVFDKISLSDASKFIGYDLVFLDMMGVVNEDPRYGGLQLIKRIKDLPDPPIVVAVSGARFDPTATDYFKAADDVLKKPLSEYKCEEVVIDLLMDKLSPNKSADVIDGEIMSKCKDEKEKGKVLDLFYRYLEGKLTADDLRSELLNKYRHMDTALLIAKARRIKDAYDA